MKNLKFILLFAISIAMLSCGDDDDGSSSSDLTIDNIAGTYNLTFLESTFVEVEQINAGGTATTTTEEVGDTFQDSNIVLNSNGTYTTDFQYRVVITTTSTQDDAETTEETEILTESDSGTYTIDEENETITFDNESIANITRFNGEDLRLEFNDVFVENDFTETITTELRFERQ